MEAPITHFCVLLGNAPDCAIGALIGLHGQKCIQNNSNCGWVSFNGEEWGLRKKVKKNSE
jgi:membrane-bound ClpP family serine protease